MGARGGRKEGAANGECIVTNGKGCGVTSQGIGYGVSGINEFSLVGAVGAV
jgi:hypothetical protein